ncbi:SdrD B-like domain-containing protein, partial [Acaricomes phytoseiuli]|uniref:SdrD B-like domain-containing protein n=1 Tax=Acaricomes phytoseiuli TaxID=291968 RepID=UPI0012EA1C78
MLIDRFAWLGKAVIATLTAVVFTAASLIIPVTFGVAPAQAASDDGALTLYVNRTTTGNPSYDPQADLPQPGIDVQVTDASGGAVSGRTDAQGRFVLDPSAQLSGGQYRVEVSVPASLNYLVPAPAKPGGDYSSFVNFVDLRGGKAAEIRTAVWNPNDYSQAQNLVIPFQRNPFPGATEKRSLVMFDKDARGNQVNNLKALAPQEITGSLYGTAYDATAKRVFSGAIAKRHTPYGVGGPGAIYVSPLDGPADGSGTRVFATVPDAGTTEHTGTDSGAYPYARDASFFEAPGKESLGDVELSEDGKTLYTVNMNTKSLVAFDATRETASAPSLTTAIPNPGCVGGEWRPMGLGVRDGKLYVGGVCDASGSKNRSDLKAAVYTFDGQSFQQVLTKSLDYQKGASMLGANPNIAEWWNPWIDDSTLRSQNYASSAGGLTRPMPELADIEFNQEGSMILGFRDRLGDQLGFRAFPPTPTGGGPTISTVVGGGVNMACKNSDGSFSWEGTNGCPDNVVPSYNGQLRSGVVKFFVGQSVYGNLHQEPSQGSVLSLLGDNNVVTNSIDPTNEAWTAGVQYLSLRDGTGEYRQGSRGGDRAAKLANTTRDSFGKGNGLGDLSAITSPAPVQIGNRVWFDSNADGIQTPGEPSVPGLVVNLIKDGAVIGSRTTDANGEYYFSSTDSDLGGKLLPGGGDYTVEFVKPSEGQLDLVGKPGLQWSDIQFTQAEVGTNRAIDSNANPANGRAPVTVGGSGFVDHTIDAGLVEIETPGYEHTKTSDPAPGTSVRGGDKITYTVTGKNTGRTVLDPVKITDDMSKVLDKAAYNNDVVARVFNADGSQVSGVPAASLDGSTLSWSGALE